MTLGGLALAVGILVDDATVTIENINWHLEHGQGSRSGDPGWRPADRHAGLRVAAVHLHRLCADVLDWAALPAICSVPLAEAVIFAMVASYRALAHARADLGQLPAAQAGARGAFGPHDRHGRGFDAVPASSAAIRCCDFRGASSMRFEAIRGGYLGLLQLGLLNRRQADRRVSSASRAVVCACALSRARTFSRTSMAGRSSCMCGRQTGTRIEETAAELATGSTRRFATSFRPKSCDGIVDNIGLPRQRHQRGLQQFGDDRCRGCRHPDQPQAEDHAPTADYVKAMREQLPRLFPGTTFAFLPADMVSQILNFGAPAPIDLQVIGNDLRATGNMPTSCCRGSSQIPGIADARIQQAFQQPTLNVNVDRSLARSGRFDREGCGDGDADHALRQFADFANLLA